MQPCDRHYTNKTINGLLAFRSSRPDDRFIDPVLQGRPNPAVHAGKQRVWGLIGFVLGSQACVFPGQLTALNVCQSAELQHLPAVAHLLFILNQPFR